MQKFRSYVLPIAIVLGLIFHKYCALFSVAVPYIIFAILLLTFSAVDVKRMHLRRLDVWLLLFQVFVSLGSYLILVWAGADNVVAEGVLVGVLCPVASSVAVVSCMLGADRETVTTFTILSNLTVAVVAPLYFSFIGTHQDMPFFESFWLILRRVGSVIGLPFFLAWAVQSWLPRLNAVLCRYKGLAFYLWAFALLFTLGQTFDFVFAKGAESLSTILWLGVVSLFFCVLQFGLGRKLGRRYGDVVAGGQLLGQKNSAMGIWMANYYLTPLASLFLAFYSIYQNVFNSWQLWRMNRK